MKDLTRHLEEAMELNTQRMPLYNKLTNGATLKYSKQLILYERMALLGAWIFDRVGDQLQAKGVPYMKAEFVEMSLVPNFSETYPPHIDYERPLQKIELKSFKQQIKKQIKVGDFDGVVETCSTFLEALEHQAHVYCLLRHVVESLRRIAFLIPIHQENCQALAIKFPVNYSIFLLHTHRLILVRSKKFDEAIAPIQIKGIPFIYQDLPAINLEL